MKPDLSLYLIADPDIISHLSFLHIVEEAIKGGVTAVQLRCKKRTPDEFLVIAQNLRSLTLTYRVPLLINDNVQVALEAGADGIHLGQQDISIEDAREIIGSEKIIGFSTHTSEEAQEAEKKGANYIGVGSVFPTVSKNDICGIIGTDGLKQIRRSVSLTMIAIGGIDLTNAASVIQTGVDGVAVISSIMKSDDPRKTAEKFRKIIDEVRREKT